VRQRRHGRVRSELEALPGEADGLVEVRAAVQIRFRQEDVSLGEGGIAHDRLLQRLDLAHAIAHLLVQP
jgi:hypothetical protein